MPRLLRDGMLIDGSGTNARRADVVVDGDRIAAVTEPGEVVPDAHTQVVELDGLVLAPGFIDIHTHYDAQILWDGDLTPSSWHGVTSAITGNCGFSIAPTRPEHRDLVVRILENVEGMTIEALDEGIDWSFTTFAEYLDAIDARATRLNVGVLAGHTALRLFVMGPEERPALPDEVAQMCALLRDAMTAGAIGFSTSRQPTHHGAFGRPVPSRFADDEEVRALASVLGDLRRGILQVSIGPGLFVEQCSELAVTNDIPVTWTALVARADKPGAAQRTVERAAALPGEVYPQVACRPIVMQVNLMDPVPLSELDVWQEVLGRPRGARADLYRDPAWRARARDVTLAAWDARWPKTSIQETATHPEAVGIGLDRAARERGTNPFDFMVDVALADEMTTRFRIVIDNDGDDELGALLADPRTLLGLSDAGAHASQLCDAGFSTHLLGHWVRVRGAIDLERAVWRLTGHPHAAFRIPRRGLVRAGFFADLVAFDPDTVGCAEPERVFDQPGGADRLIARSTGIEHVWVNGVAVRAHGVELDGVAPGRVVRSDPA